jgi:hypothetical protein
MSVLLANVEAAVREYYSGGVEDLTYNVDDTLSEIEEGRDAEELNSRGASLVIRPLNNVSERWGTAELQDYPNPGVSPLVKTTVVFTGVTATCLFSNHVLAENQSATTIANLVTGELDNKLENLRDSQDFYLWGDGTGERARVSGVASLVVTCNNSGNLYGVQMLEQGMEVEFRTSAGVLHSGGGITYGTIQSVDYANLTFTLDQIPSDAANNDRVVLRGSYGSAPRGFLYHVAPSGAWQGLSDRTIYRGTTPTTITASGALTQGLLEKMHSARALKTGKRDRDGGRYKLYVSSQFSAYVAIGFDMKTVTGNSFDAGFADGQVDYAGTPFRFSKHVQRDFVWELNVKKMRIYRMQKVQMVKNDGGGIFHLINAASGQLHASGKAVYWEGFFNYGVKDPVALGTYISGLSTTNLALGNTA